MTIDDPIRGKVAKVVNARELAINRGANQGVEKGMVFAVLDPMLENVVDPDTGMSLGSLERPKIYVKVTEVTENFSLARTYRYKYKGGGNLSGVAGLFEPRKAVYETFHVNHSNWEEIDESESFVKTGDPVKEVEVEDEG